MRLRLDQLGDALSVEEAAGVLGISRNSAYEAVRQGQIPALRIGRTIRVPASGLRRLLEGEVAAEEPTEPRQAKARGLSQGTRAL